MKRMFLLTLAFATLALAPRVEAAELPSAWPTWIGQLEASETIVSIPERAYVRPMVGVRHVLPVQFFAITKAPATTATSVQTPAAPAAFGGESMPESWNPRQEPILQGWPTWIGIPTWW